MDNYKYDPDLIFIDIDEPTTPKPIDVEPAKRSNLLFHLGFLAVFVIIVVLIIHRFANWGTYIDLNELAQSESQEYVDNMDVISPLTDADGYLIRQNINNILLFGNSPFSDDRDSADSFANMLAKQTGATVYNASVAGSTLSCQEYTYDAEIAPMDAYSLYWLAHLATTRVTDEYIPEAEAALGNNAPAESSAVHQMLQEINIADMDVVLIMYDATDYLIGKQMYVNENHTDINCFGGALQASLELMSSYCPKTRFIIMSPTFAYAVDSEGNYKSSLIENTGFGTLDSYCFYQITVNDVFAFSYVDNLFGTITEENADEYLVDNIHLNQAGRELLLKRALGAITFYAPPSDSE